MLAPVLYRTELAINFSTFRTHRGVKSLVEALISIQRMHVHIAISPTPNNRSMIRKLMMVSTKHVQGAFRVLCYKTDLSSHKTYSRMSNLFTYSNISVSQQY